MTRLKVTGSDQPMPRYGRICVADHVQSTWLERPAATLERSRRLHARAPRIPASAGGPGTGAGTGVGGAVATMKLSMVFHLFGKIPPEVEVKTVRGVVEIHPKKLLVELAVAERELFGSMPLVAKALMVWPGND